MSTVQAAHLFENDSKSSRTAFPDPDTQIISVSPPLKRERKKEQNRKRGGDRRGEFKETLPLWAALGEKKLEVGKEQ